MLEAVCVAFPGILTVFLMEKMQKKKLCVHDWIGVAVANITLINLILNAFLTLVWNGGDFSLHFETGMIRADIAMKYLATSCVIGLFLCIAETLLMPFIAVEATKEQTKDENT